MEDQTQFCNGGLGHEFRGDRINISWNYYPMTFLRGVILTAVKRISLQREIMFPPVVLMTLAITL